MKKVLAVILASIMMFSLMSVGVSASGDTMATATNVTFGTKYTGTIDESNTRDYYKIVLSESGALTINETVFAGMYYALYNEDGGTLVAEALSTAYTAGGFANKIFTTHLTAGTYYFDFHKWNSFEGDYQIKFTFESANETIQEVNGGTNEKLTSASDISLNKKYHGQIAENEAKDFYKFTVKNKSKVQINLNVFPYVYCSICDENGAIVKDFRLLGYNYNINTSSELELDKGVYYICFSKGNGCCGNYNFTISADGVTAPDEPSTPDKPEKPGDSGSSTGDSFIVTILVGIWEFFVNIFTFLFGWIIDLI